MEHGGEGGRDAAALDEEQGECVGLGLSKLDENRSTFAHGEGSRVDGEVVPVAVRERARQIRTHGKRHEFVLAERARRVGRADARHVRRGGVQKNGGRVVRVARLRVARLRDVLVIVLVLVRPDARRRRPRRAHPLAETIERTPRRVRVREPRADLEPKRVRGAVRVIEHADEVPVGLVRQPRLRRHDDRDVVHPGFAIGHHPLPRPDGGRDVRRVPKRGVVARDVAVDVAIRPRALERRARRAGPRRASAVRADGGREEHRRRVRRSRVREFDHQFAIARFFVVVVVARGDGDARVPPPSDVQGRRDDGLVERERVYVARARVSGGVGSATTRPRVASALPGTVQRTHVVRVRAQRRGQDERRGLGRAGEPRSRAPPLSPEMRLPREEPRERNLARIGHAHDPFSGGERRPGRVPARTRRVRLVHRVHHVRVLVEIPRAVILRGVVIERRERGERDVAKPERLAVGRSRGVDQRLPPESIRARRTRVSRRGRYVRTRVGARDGPVTPGEAAAVAPELPRAVPVEKDRGDGGDVRRPGATGGVGEHQERSGAVAVSVREGHLELEHEILGLVGRDDAKISRLSDADDASGLCAVGDEGGKRHGAVRSDPSVVARAEAADASTSRGAVVVARAVGEVSEGETLVAVVPRDETEVERGDGVETDGEGDGEGAGVQGELAGAVGDGVGGVGVGDVQEVVVEDGVEALEDEGYALVRGGGGGEGAGRAPVGVGGRGEGRRADDPRAVGVREVQAGAAAVGDGAGGVGERDAVRGRAAAGGRGPPGPSEGRRRDDAARRDGALDVRGGDRRARDGEKDQREVRGGIEADAHGV